MDVKEVRKEKCYGMCLKNTHYINHFYRSEDCGENCQPIKCPNYKLCGKAESFSNFDCHSSRCIYCNQSFGCNLTFIEKKEECPICLEDKDLFIRWQCEHDLCVECFRINNGWTESFLQAPTIETEPRVYTDEEWIIVKIEQDKREAEWEIEDAKRVIILDENGWEVESPPVERPEYIGKCPLCRHHGVPDWLRRHPGWIKLQQEKIGI